MRTTKARSITLPPEMLARTEEMARERTQWWDSMNAYGRANAEECGLTEADVVAAVRAVRGRRASQHVSAK